MWITQFTTFLMAGVAWLISSAATQSSIREEFPSWMDQTTEQSFDFNALDENRPAFLYLYELNSIPCKMVTRDRLNRPGFADPIRKKFNCIAIQSSHIPGWLRKFTKQQQFPIIALVDPKKRLVYSCEQFQEEIIFNGQFDCFLSACSIQGQADLLKNTSKYSIDESLAEIGKGYARRDHKKNPGFSPYYYTYKYTLNMKPLNAFAESFVKEWDALSQPVLKPIVKPLPQPQVK